MTIYLYMTYIFNHWFYSQWFYSQFNPLSKNFKYGIILV